jgi:hypothetical protein
MICLILTLFSMLDKDAIVWNLGSQACIPNINEKCEGVQGCIFQCSSTSCERIHEASRAFYQQLSIIFGCLLDCGPVHGGKNLI